MSGLSPPLIEALRGAAHGETAGATARRLYLSEHTVKAWRKQAIRALGARNLPHAVTIAAERIRRLDELRPL